MKSGPFPVYELYPSLTCRTHCNNACGKCAAEISAVRSTSVVPEKIRAGLNTAKLACNSLASPLDTMSSKNFTSADKPFDSSSKANIILRSSNRVDFFVMKGLLQLVSPVFDRMISEPLNERRVEDRNDEKNELSTTPRENSAPRPRRSVFNMVFKGGKAKSNDNAKNALRAFAVASYFCLAGVMKESALSTLKIPLHDLGGCEELRLLTISEYHDLLQWRFACRDAVKHTLVKLEPQADSPLPFPEVVKSCRLADAEINEVLPMVRHKMPAQTVNA